MIKEITSKSNAKIKYLVSLHNSKDRKEHKQFLAEGKKSLDMALERNLVQDIFTLSPIGNVPTEINQYIVNEEIMDKISSTKSPEGIVFLCNMPKYDIKNAKKIVYLDHLNDPGNVGTIIRTALAFGYDAVVASEDSCDIYNEKVISATKGAIFALPVVKANINDIKNDHVIIASTLSDKSISLEEAQVNKPFILVLGNESHGVSQEVLDMSQMYVKIPINTRESLNVSIAAGILMYHFK